MRKMIWIALMLLLGSGLASAGEHGDPGIPCDCPQCPMDPPADPVRDDASFPKPGGAWTAIFMIWVAMSPI